MAGKPQSFLFISWSISKQIHARMAVTQPTVIDAALRRNHQKSKQQVKRAFKQVSTRKDEKNDQIKNGRSTKSDQKNNNDKTKEWALT